MIVLEEYKAIYFAIPKCANTSLKATFYEMLHGKEPKNPHDWNIFKTINSKELVTTYKDYFKFTFVRDESKRLLSCYKSNLKSLSEGYPSYFDKDMTYEEFLDMVKSIPPLKRDIHIQPCSHFYPEKIDFIGDVDYLEEDYLRLCKKIGIKNPSKLKHLNKSEDF